MSYQIITQPEAQNDIAEALTYHEEQQKGLGLQLLDAFDDAFARIQENPLKYEVRYRDIRVGYILQYRYSIHFRILGDNIVITAVLHTSRNPNMWTERIK